MPRCTEDFLAGTFEQRVVNREGHRGSCRKQLGHDQIGQGQSDCITRHELPPRRTGRSGRPRTRGARLGTPADVAALATNTNTWRTTQVRRQGVGKVAVSGR